MVSVPDPEVTGLQWSFIVNVPEVQPPIELYGQCS